LRSLNKIDRYEFPALEEIRKKYQSLALNVQDTFTTDIKDF
jgi:hypothetical protein